MIPRDIFLWSVFFFGMTLGQVLFNWYAGWSTVGVFAVSVAVGVVVLGMVIWNLIYLGRRRRARVARRSRGGVS